MTGPPAEDWKRKLEAYATLIDAFGEGWEAGSAERMADVFTEQATFVPDAFASPVVGRSAIGDYWSDIPLEQSEVSFRSGETYVAGPWFATEFRCTFRRRRTGEPVDVRGALFCETENGLISEMRMYWDRRTGA